MGVTARWPSGKATDFDSVIVGSNPTRAAKQKDSSSSCLFVCIDATG